LDIILERAQDWQDVRALNLAAFESSTEADLVDALRQQGEATISVVALDEGRVIGHILFSPVTLNGQPAPRIAGLAPMAVVPGKQRQGIGSALVREGLQHCRTSGFVALVVVGHAKYYPRFGFTPASRFGLRCEYEVPDDVFMAIELEAGALKGCSGTIQYHPAFAEHPDGRRSD